MDEDSKTKQQDVEGKNEEFLQQIRIVLPGTEALLGFQFSVFFDSGFRALPAAVRELHIVNLLLISVSTLLLVAPVGFKQIVTRGNDTAHFLRFTHKMLLGAMIFLLLGMSSDVYVAARLTLPLDHDGDSPVYIGLAVGIFLIGLILWFMLHFMLRRTKKR